MRVHHKARTLGHSIAPLVREAVTTTTNAWAGGVADYICLRKAHGIDSVPSIFFLTLNRGMKCMYILGEVLAARHVHRCGGLGPAAPAIVFVVRRAGSQCSHPYLLEPPHRWRFGLLVTMADGSGNGALQPAVMHAVFAYAEGAMGGKDASHDWYARRRPCVCYRGPARGDIGWGRVEVCSC